MINEISIDNYQSHEKSTIRLDSGVNIIVGLSDSGKSAIIRAINWVIRNRPLGDKFIRFDSNKASVKISQSDSKSSVTRSKDGNKNQYIISIDGSDDLVLSSFGSDVPNQVVDLLNIQDVNLQRQFSPYFLVFDSPGSVAEYIRKITRVDEIDKISNVLSRRLRSVTTDVSSIEGQINEIQGKLDEIDKIDIESLDHLISCASSLLVEIDSTKSRSDSIMSIVNLVCRIDDEMINLPGEIDELIEVAELKTAHFTTIASRLSELSRMVSTIYEIDDSLVVLPEHTSEIIEVSSGLINTYNKLVEKETEVANTLIEIDSVDKTIRELELSIEVETKELVMLRSQMTECPTCGQELDEDGIKRVCGIEV